MLFLSLCFLFLFRVYLLYHTWSQVIYGGVAGSTFGIIWFFFTQEVLTPIFPKIAAWYVALSFLCFLHVTGEDNPISFWITGWTCLLHVWLLYKSSFSSDVLDRLFHYLIGQFRSTSWCETQVWSPTSYGLSIQSPDQRRGKLLHWSRETFNLTEVMRAMSEGYEDSPKVTHTFPYTCMLPVFYHLMSCRAVLCLRGMQNVVVHVYVAVNSVYMPSCAQDNWIIVAFMCKTNRQSIYSVHLFFFLFQEQTTKAWYKTSVIS